MANAAHPRTIHAVDTWRGSPGEISATLAAERDIHGQFRANIAVYTAGNVTEHHMDWRDWVATIDQPVALAFIDAEHSYQEVVDTVYSLLPHMARGGILCGDDIMHPPVRAAVADTLGPYRVMVGASMWWWTS